MSRDYASNMFMRSIIDQLMERKQAKLKAETESNETINKT